MNKIWYIEISGKTEGPWSVKDLKRDRRITPDTLVWKEGFTKWVPIRDVPELKIVFADDTKSPEDIENPNIVRLKSSPISTDNQLVLDLQTNPPYFFWILVALTVLFYAFLHLYFQNE